MIPPRNPVPRPDMAQVMIDNNSTAFTMKDDGKMTSNRNSTPSYSNVSLWEGRPITDYGKDDLIMIVEKLSAMQRKEFLQSRHEDQILNHFRIANHRRSMTDVMTSRNAPTIRREKARARIRLAGRILAIVAAALVAVIVADAALSAVMAIDDLAAEAVARGKW